MDQSTPQTTADEAQHIILSGVSVFEEQTITRERQDIRSQNTMPDLFCKPCDAICEVVGMQPVPHPAMVGWAVTARCSSCNIKLYFCTLCCAHREGDAVAPWTALASVRGIQAHARKNRRHREAVSSAAALQLRDQQVAITQAASHLPETLEDGMAEPMEDDKSSGNGMADDVSLPCSEPEGGMGDDCLAHDWLQALGDDAISGKVTSLAELKDSCGFDAQSNSPEFYLFEATHPGEGAMFLTAKAFSLRPDDISADEARFSLHMAKFLGNLTKSEQGMLAECMFHAANSKDPALSIFKNTRVPTSVQDFRDFYLEGRNAILPNLPHAVVQSSDDGSHAYVRLTDVIANMLAAATPVEQFHFEASLQLEGRGYAAYQAYDGPSGTDRPTISSTNAAYDLYVELSKTREEQVIGRTPTFVLKLWFKEWSDDFDPNSTKASRNQVWIKTKTVCPPATEGRGRNTFVMAISDKGEDHEGIEEIFADELQHLSKNGSTFYHGGLRGLIHVKVGKLTTCVDRPERTSMFQVGDHNGSFSLFWCHAAKVDGACKENHLPSCPFCRTKCVRKQLGLTIGDQLSEGVHDAYADGADTNMSSSVDDEVCSNGMSATTGTNSDCDGVSSVSSNDAAITSPVAVSAVGECLQSICSGWDVLDPSFTSATPTSFPTMIDRRAGAPLAPKGREITEESNATRRLPSIYLTVEWLKTAVVCAHHQIKTNPPGTNVRKRYWTKGNLVAFLRTCGISKKLQDEIYKSAKRDDATPPLPATWSHSAALQKCHYAAMHMLFLGHVKSNYDMCAKLLSGYEILATVGKQANTYLLAIQNLRCRRYFHAQPLSTSSWGTGVWVSENYLFWGRAQKFFYVLPSIIESKHKGKPLFEKDTRMLQRFAMAAGACLCRLMTEKRVVDDMEVVIKIYLDTMVEMDRWIEEIKKTVTPAAGGADEDHNNTEQAGPTKNKKSANFRNRAKKPNFVKGNSLGLLAAADAHKYFGPAILHWEGDFAGEKKIQEVKPRLGIKRGNADWAKIVLTKMYQSESLDILLDNLKISGPGGGSDTSTKVCRGMEGVIKVYKSRGEVDDALSSSPAPLSGLEGTDGSVWIAYRHSTSTTTDGDAPQEGCPHGVVQSRSTVKLLRICFDDEKGESVANSCWFAPIYTDGDVRWYSSTSEMDVFARQYVLLLPRMHPSSGEFQNNYHVMGHKWTERVSSGAFCQTELNQEVFGDWL